MSRVVPAEQLEPRWSDHAAAWRDPAAVIAGCDPAPSVDPGLLQARTRGHFWDVLREQGVTLLVTREYEHLVLAVSAPEGRARVSYLTLPHPSGIVRDLARGVVYVAATRNPNQIVTLAPVSGARERTDLPSQPPVGRPLLPRAARYLPGCLYLHDLALIGGRLYANAVGENAVVRFEGDGEPKRVWWPRAIERPGRGPDFSRNYLQLNSIAPARTLAGSFFSASTDRISGRQPGHRNFAVDRRGVIFSGRTREPVVRGLTRPHSARLHEGALWVDNSGYGEVGIGSDGRFEPVARLGGWTRGLCFAGQVAFVGTSRVIPRYRRYAPGLDVDRSECAVHVIDLQSGTTLASLHWPRGNQIFALEVVPESFTLGFPRSPRKRTASRHSALFYGFEFGKENER